MGSSVRGGSYPIFLSAAFDDTGIPIFFLLRVSLSFYFSIEFMADKVIEQHVNRTSGITCRARTS